MNFRKYNTWNFLKFPCVLMMILMGLTACGKDPLFSDQAMIAHFHAHRETFETLVATAKVYDENWERRSDIIALKKQAGIEAVIGSNGSPRDDPYARDRDPKQKLKKLNEEQKKEQEWNHRYLRENLVIKMRYMGYYKRNYELAGQLNWKDYIYFYDGRSPARYSNHVRWDPVGRNPKYKEIRLGYKVVTSLDASTERAAYRVRGVHRSLYAVDWHHGAGCIVKKIEPKWFLRRCWLN